LGWRTEQAGNLLSGVPYFLNYSSRALSNPNGLGTLFITIVTAAANDANFLIMDYLYSYLSHVWVKPSPGWEAHLKVKYEQ
jgi:hypothetical protein